MLRRASDVAENALEGRIRPQLQAREGLREKQRAFPVQSNRCDDIAKLGSRVRSLHERQVHVVDGFVDLLRALEAYRCAIDVCLLKGEAHRGHAVFMLRECAVAA